MRQHSRRQPPASETWQGRAPAHRVGRARRRGPHHARHQDSADHAEPVTRAGKYGRPPRRGAAVHCLEPADFAAAATGGSGPRGRKEPLPPNPEPDEELTLPGTPLYGTVTTEPYRTAKKTLTREKVKT